MRIQKSLTEPQFQTKVIVMTLVLICKQLIILIYLLNLDKEFFS